MDKKRLPFKKILLISLIVIFLVGFSWVIIQKIRSNTARNQDSLYSKKVKVGQSFEFFAQNEEGVETDKKVKLTISEVEQTNQILVKGKKLKAKSEKLFTIVHLELENSHQGRLTLEPFELIRLIDSEGKSFAPDVHNSRVTLQPISVKRDRVGFLLASKEKNIKIQIGEISGEKKVIQVKF